jgi:hypothetical protein
VKTFTVTVLSIFASILLPLAALLVAGCGRSGSTKSTRPEPSWMSIREDWFANQVAQTNAAPIEPTCKGKPGTYWLINHGTPTAIEAIREMGPEGFRWMLTQDPPLDMSRNWMVRGFTVALRTSKHTNEITKIMLEALNSTDRTVRLNAVIGVWSYAAPQARARLLELAKDSDPEIRCWAFEHIWAWYGPDVARAAGYKDPRKSGVKENPPRR